MSDTTEQLQKAIKLLKDVETTLGQCFEKHCEAVGITPADAEFFEPYQIRVIVERNELVKKIDALEMFLDANPSTLSYVEKSLMIDQLSAMWHYKRILNERIENFYRVIPRNEE